MSQRQEALAKNRWRQEQKDIIESTPGLGDAVAAMLKMIPDGWELDGLFRSGRTWTASVSPKSGAARSHYHYLTGADRKGHPGWFQGQGDDPSEAIADLTERIRVDMDPRLKVYKA